ncbi:MAG: ABC transporter permease [Candidatus Lokiarchaeota archaeon]|nr:ABC transporter permease [Candidatus Lokiarchaeota archaeon]
MSKKIAKRELPPMRFLVLVKKELASIWADKQALAIIFLLPIVAVTALGFTGQGGGQMLDNLVAGRETRMGVVNLDTSVGDPRYVLSEEFINILGQQPAVTITRYDSIYAANESLYYERIIGFVVINNGFEFNVSAHLPTFVPFYSSALYILAQPLMAKKVNDAIKDFKVAYNFTEDEINYSSDDQYQINSPLFVAWPMTLSITVMAAALMLSCQSVVGDNPIMRVTLTPGKRFEIISAKVAAYTLLEMMEGAVLTVFPYFAFGLTFPGDMLSIIIFATFGAYCGVCMGVFLSTLATTKLQGSQFFLVGFMAVFILGSGIFIQGLDKIFPMGYSMKGIKLLAYKAVPLFSETIWALIWPQIIYGTVFFAAAYIMFKLKKEAI